MKKRGDVNAIYQLLKAHHPEGLTAHQIAVALGYANANSVVGMISIGRNRAKRPWKVVSDHSRPKLYFYDHPVPTRRPKREDPVFEFVRLPGKRAEFPGTHVARAELTFADAPHKSFWRWLSDWFTGGDF